MRDGKRGPKRHHNNSMYFKFQSFACCKRRQIQIGSRLPFCLDVCRSTFERIDLLLRSVCENLDASQGAYPPLHQDQECMVVATLNLLKLQVH